MVGLGNALILIYVLGKWKSIVPKKGVVSYYIPRYRREKKVENAIEAHVVHLVPALTISSKDIEAGDTLVILCPVCLGATPVPKDIESNTVKCQYCGAEIALCSIYTPCKNHPNRLVVGQCAVCGNYFCQECLSPQKPPEDSK